MYNLLNCEHCFRLTSSCFHHQNYSCSWGIQKLLLLPKAVFVALDVSLFFDFFAEDIYFTLFGDGFGGADV